MKLSREERIQVSGWAGWPPPEIVGPDCPHEWVVMTHIYDQVDSDGTRPYDEGFSCRYCQRQDEPLWHGKVPEATQPRKFPWLEVP